MISLQRKHVARSANILQILQQKKRKIGGTKFNLKVGAVI
jgi:hypothetical protein